MTLPEASNAPAPEQKKPRKKPERAEAGFNLQYMPYIIEHHRHTDPATGKPTAIKLKVSVLSQITKDKFGKAVTPGALRKSLAALNIADPFYKPAEPRKKGGETTPATMTMESLAARVQQLEQTKTKTPAVGKKLRQELDEIDTHFTLTLQALIQSTIISCRKQEAARREWLLEFTAKAKASACDVTELQVVLAKAPEDSFLELEASLSEFKQQGAAARNKRQRQQQLQFKDDSEAGSQQEPTSNKPV